MSFIPAAFSSLSRSAKSTSPSRSRARQLLPSLQHRWRMNTRKQIQRMWKRHEISVLKKK